RVRWRRPAHALHHVGPDEAGRHGAGDRAAGRQPVCLRARRRRPSGAALPQEPPDMSTDGPSVALIDSAERMAYCRDLFVAVGMPADDAKLTAEQLVTADLRGVESHGVVRVPIYLERLRRGVIEPRPQCRI